MFGNFHYESYTTLSDESYHDKHSLYTGVTKEVHESLVYNFEFLGLETYIQPDLIILVPSISATKKVLSFVTIGLYTQMQPQ